ncbi:hypothetical protein [uncultured Amnibacterium sp.]|uniref:hypothetical protein n=1 Tax=uncultured Amnibacterium sp. TaxID=1631851 RepID=UPI0035C973EC
MSRSSLAVRDPLLLGAPAPVFAAGGAVLALVAAGTEVLLARDQVSSWALEAVALAALVGAGVLVVVLANPFRAPFRARSHAAVLGLVLLAVVLDEAAQAGRNTALHDDWGLAVVPVFLLVLAILRPPLEVLVGGLAAVALVVLVVLLLSSATAPVPPAGRAAITATQLLPPAVAVAVLAWTTLRRLDVRPPDPAVVPAADPALTVRQEAVAQLEAAAIPLLGAIAGSGAVTAEQATRAREIAAELRSVLVAGLARGWLVEAGFVVDDPDDYAERLTTEQRAALRTTVASLPLADFERPGSVTVRGQDRTATIVLSLPVAVRPRRSRVAPLVPLLRSVLPRAEIRIGGDRVLVLVDVVVEP